MPIFYISEIWRLWCAKYSNFHCCPFSNFADQTQALNGNMWTNSYAIVWRLLLFRGNVALHISNVSSLRVIAVTVRCGFKRKCRAAILYRVCMLQGTGSLCLCHKTEGVLSWTQHLVLHYFIRTALWTIFKIEHHFVAHWPFQNWHSRLMVCTRALKPELRFG